MGSPTSGGCSTSSSRRGPEGGDGRLPGEAGARLHRPLTMAGGLGRRQNRYARPRTDPAMEAFWHEFLTRGDPRAGVQARIQALPHDPRMPDVRRTIVGAFAPVMRVIGKPQSRGNPNWCNSCMTFIPRTTVVRKSRYHAVRRHPGFHHTGRGSSAAEFHALLDRFYATATRTVFGQDGYVDKFVGDELVSLFFPLLSGERHAARAVEAAKELLMATGHADRGGPWAPRRRRALRGRLVRRHRRRESLELTAVGDAVNTAARLAAMAGAGEVLVTADAATRGGA